MPGDSPRIPPVILLPLWALCHKKATLQLSTSGRLAEGVRVLGLGFQGVSDLDLEVRVLSSGFKI